MTRDAEADPFNLERYVAAQEATYARALTELVRGLKTSHWMWFIFPQVTRLGIERDVEPLRDQLD